MTQNAPGQPSGGIAVSAFSFPEYRSAGGRRLKQVLDEQGLLNEEQAYDIAVQLADILVRLHQLEPAIVHRDIKLSNIIIEKTDM